MKRKHLRLFTHHKKGYYVVETTVINKDHSAHKISLFPSSTSSLVRFTTVCGQVDFWMSSVVVMHVVRTALRSVHYKLQKSHQSRTTDVNIYSFNQCLRLVTKSVFSVRFFGSSRTMLNQCRHRVEMEKFVLYPHTIVATMPLNLGHTAKASLDNSSKSSCIIHPQRSDFACVREEVDG